VYGDILRLRVPRHLQPLLSSTVRGLVHGVPVYIVPRDDGTVVIGATQREDALGVTPSEGAVSAGGVYQLLRDAQVLVPAVAELELLECTTRARPATPDNAPLLGRVAASSGGPDIPGLIIATGFFRHGILLAPAAAAICSQLMEGRAYRRWAAFRPDRFSGAPCRKPVPYTPDQQTMPSAAAPVKASGTTLPTKETT
jgi:glycine oxidase